MWTRNYKAMRRYGMLKHMLAQMGVEPESLKLIWASAAEGQHWRRPWISWWPT